MNITSNFSHQITNRLSLTVPPISRQLPEKRSEFSGKHTSEKFNNVSKNVDGNENKKDDFLQVVWQKTLIDSYVKSQKAMINAYTRSATGENAFDTSNNKTSLSEQYKALMQYQAEQYDISSVPSQLPQVNKDDVSELQKVNLQTQRQLNNYHDVISQSQNSIFKMQA